MFCFYNKNRRAKQKHLPYTIMTSALHLFKKCQNFRTLCYSVSQNPKCFKLARAVDNNFIHRDRLQSLKNVIDKMYFLVFVFILATQRVVSRQVHMYVCNYQNYLKQKTRSKVKNNPALLLFTTLKNIFFPRF